MPTEQKVARKLRAIFSADVVQDGDRIFGEGVNVAARIESLAMMVGFVYLAVPMTRLRTEVRLHWIP